MKDTQQATKLVLMIEDNADDRQVYGDLLWYNGYDVVHAVTGEQGYWLAREGEPDLIVLDLHLPDADGLALCRRLRAHPQTARIPIVVLSARDEVPTAFLSARAGCARYLQKPRRPIELLHAVVELIGAAPPGQPPPWRRRCG